MKYVQIPLAIILLIFWTALADGGWVYLNSRTTYSLNMIQFPGNTQTGYVVGIVGTMKKTTDGGLNWVSQVFQKVI